MALTTYSAGKLLDLIGNQAAWTAPTVRYVKLHIGDPGAAATANAAANTTRKQMGDEASSGNVLSNDADLAWTNVSNSETYTHFSLWDHATAGNALVTGTLNGGTGYAVVATNNFTIPTGDLDITADVSI